MVVTFCKDVHSLQRMDPNDFGDPLTLSSYSCSFWCFCIGFTSQSWRLLLGYLSTTIAWIATKFGAGIHAPQRNTSFILRIKVWLRFCCFISKLSCVSLPFGLPRSQNWLGEWEYYHNREKLWSKWAWPPFKFNHELLLLRSVVAYTEFIVRKRSESSCRLWEQSTPRHVRVHLRVTPSLSPAAVIFLLPLQFSLHRQSRHPAERDERRGEDKKDSGRLLRQQSLSESGCVWADVLQQVYEPTPHAEYRSISPD